MNDVRQFLMLWAMEFGEGAADLDARDRWYNNTPYDQRRFSAVSEPIQPYIQWEYGANTNTVRINQKGLDLIRGENDEINN